MQRLVEDCDRNGILHAAPSSAAAATFEPAFSWWLCEDKSFFRTGHLDHENGTSSMRHLLSVLDVRERWRQCGDSNQSKLCQISSGQYAEAIGALSSIDRRTLGPFSSFRTNQLEEVIAARIDPKRSSAAPGWWWYA